ncbi:hypothetical protein Pmani_035422 [Petrolisthes manimaculis]|uniref:Calpain catalytic domain-containing protein n=1 Tax=Petrolisthes manimaculis TaxID=1843537 RepID=A0AAE1TNG8_9EUCA|nr:hypothetical protein Pmani_035422 [Petrolisthes manimaculis]
MVTDSPWYKVNWGIVGLCLLLSAITLNPALLHRVIPRDQCFNRKYVGIFHFRFWQGGEWLDVVVDDRLPTDPYSGILCFSTSTYKNEFWSSLLEKAYAKLHGSYGSLNSGKSYEATEDLTGGVTERFPLQQQQHAEGVAAEGVEDSEGLFSIMGQTSQRGSLLTCSVPGRRQEGEEDGLVSGHGYCVTGVRRCRVNVPWKTHVQLVRLRNPWGDETEWRGAWSDKSEEWGLVPKEEKRSLHHTVDSDGEFWMTFEEFKRNFNELYITSLNPHSLDDQARDQLYSMSEVVWKVLANPGQVVERAGGRVRRVWEEVKFDGSWVRNSTAGGAPKDMKLFSSNPQYLLHLREADEDQHHRDCDIKRSGTCTVVISLTQKHRRVRELPLMQLGIAVYKVSDEEGAPTPLTAPWLRCHRWVFLSKFKRARSITHRLSLPPGPYVLIPCTLLKDEEGDFLLRVFCEKGATME